MVKVILLLALSTITLSCSPILVKKENLALKEKQIPTSSVKFCNLLPDKKLTFLQGTTHTFTLLV